MNKKLLFAALLLVAPFAFGMENDDELDAKILEIKCLMYTDPEQALRKSAALSLGVPQIEVNKLQQIDTSSIEGVARCEQSSFVHYTGHIKNSHDTVSAEYYKEGPCKGGYHCTRLVYSQCANFTFVPLSSQYYSILESLYNKSQEK